MASEGRTGASNRGAAGAGAGWSLRRGLTVPLLRLPRAGAGGEAASPACVSEMTLRTEEPRCSRRKIRRIPRLLGERAGAQPPEQDGDGLCLLSGDTPSGALRDTVSSAELNSELGSADPLREAALDALVLPLRCLEITRGPRCSPRLRAGAPSQAPPARQALCRVLVNKRQVKCPRLTPFPPLAAGSATDVLAGRSAWPP